MSLPNASNGTAKTRYAWVVMIGCCFLVGGSLGTVGGTASVFLFPVSEDLEIDIAALSVYLSINAIVMAALGPFAGKLLIRFKPGNVIAAASAILAGGTALYGLCQQLWQFYALSVFVAVGAAVVYFVAVPTMITLWFAERTGFAMSIALAFNGIGAMIMNVVVGAVNSGAGWRIGFFTVAGAAALLTIPTSLFLLKTPAEKGLTPYGAPVETAAGGVDAERPAQAESGPAAGSQARGLTERKAFATPAFYLMFLGQFCFSIVTASQLLLNTYGQGDLAFDPVKAGVIVSSCAFGLIVGTVMLGALTDKFGVDRATMAGCALTVVGLVLIPSATAQPSLVYVGSVVFGLGLGVFMVEPPIYVRKAFGLKAYGVIFGAVSIATTLGSAVFLPLYTRIGVGAGYGITFYASAGFTVLALVLYLTAGRVSRDYVDRFDPVVAA
jgi:MFS family permease